MLCYRQLLGRGIYLPFFGGGNEKRDKYEKSSTNLNVARGKFFNNVKEGVHLCTLHNATLGRNIHHTPVAGLNIHR